MDLNKFFNKYGRPFPSKKDEDEKSITIQSENLESEIKRLEEEKTQTTLRLTTLELELMNLKQRLEQETTTIGMLKNHYVKFDNKILYVKRIVRQWSGDKVFYTAYGTGILYGGGHIGMADSKTIYENTKYEIISREEMMKVFENTYKQLKDNLNDCEKEDDK